MFVDGNGALAIGQSYQGGIIAYIDSTGQHGLMAATADYNATLNWQGAMDYCNGLTVGQHEDWYLPNQDELNQLYVNRVAIGGFNDDYYWSSTEIDDDYAWIQNFNYGFQHYDDKDDSNYSVRGVRAF